MRNAKDLLPDHAANQLAQRLALHRRLLGIIRRALPTYLQDHCQDCWLNRRGHLVLQVDGQEYAAQIRFFLVTMQEALAKSGNTAVTQIALRTATPTTQRNPPKARATAISAQLIAQEAATSHLPEISGALGRLAASMAGRSTEKKEKGEN